MFKNLQSKLDGISNRSSSVNGMIIDLKMKQDYLSSEQLNELRSATRYAYKINNMLIRFQRRLAKKLGQTDIPVLCRSGFKLVRKYKMIEREKGELVADQWYRDQMVKLVNQ